jgi:hypothetical protein
MYLILSKLVKEENFKIRHIDLHSVRFSIGDHKAFTSVGKMYTLANVWTESGLGRGDSMKNIRRTCCSIRTKLRTMKRDVPKPQTWG